MLFGFLTLPLGTIARLSSKYEDPNNNIKLGSFTSLYQSVVNLDVVLFRNEHCKDALVNPINSSDDIYKNLKLNLDDTNSCVSGETVFVKNKGSFIITDDLVITPFSLDRFIELVNTLGVEYIDLLEKTVYFGLQEFLSLLSWSLLTNDPLTNLVLEGSRQCLCSASITNFTLGSSPSLLSNSAQPLTVKLLVQKSNKKVLCAQVENFFVEMLFSFLTIPLGAVKRLTMDNSSSAGINNVYNSILSMDDGKYLKSHEIKTMLLDPKLAADYQRVTDFLPIYEKNTCPGNFLKEQATFLVSDNLEVTISPSISSISNFTLGIPVNDIEVSEVSIGEPEALIILKASLTSTSVLTHCLEALRKNTKVESSI